MKFATILLSIVCLAGGALLLPGVRELFLDQASAVLFGGIQYGTIVLSGIS